MTVMINATPPAYACLRSIDKHGSTDRMCLIFLALGYMGCLEARVSQTGDGHRPATFAGFCMK